MRTLIPSETALVLGGGGAKGAYEIGAIAALNDLGIRAGSVYGTSVGALNAAMYAQDDMTTAEALWSSIRLSDVVSEESLAIADDAENIFDHPEKLLLKYSGRFYPPDHLHTIYDHDVPSECQSISYRYH